MMNLSKIKKLIAIAGIMSICLLPLTVHAGQGFYPLNDSIRSGMLVSLTKNTGVIEPTKETNATSMVGVVGNSEADYDIQSGQVAVQTSGVVNTLVSTLGGDIKVGDRIGPSSVVGLGSKRVQAGWIIGSAQTALSSTTPGAVKTRVTDSSGAKREVFVATIPVQVNVIYYNAEQQEVEKTTPIPSKVQDLADSFAGRQASQVAIVLSFILLVAGFVVAGIIVNAAVKNGIISIARQPMARQSISGRMAQSFTMAIGIIFASVVGALVLLRVL